MTRHDTNVDCHTIEILREDGCWSTFRTHEPAEARWFWDTAMTYGVPRPVVPEHRIRWVCWKEPGKTRYRARASFGREPDCPNCCAGGCPIAGCGYLPGESIEAQTARINASFPMFPAGQVEAEVAADVRRLFDGR